MHHMKLNNNGIQWPQLLATKNQSEGVTKLVVANSIAANVNRLNFQLKADNVKMD